MKKKICLYGTFLVFSLFASLCQVLSDEHVYYNLTKSQWLYYSIRSGGLGLTSCSSCFQLQFGFSESRLPFFPPFSWTVSSQFFMQEEIEEGKGKQRSLKPVMVSLLRFQWSLNILVWLAFLWIVIQWITSIVAHIYYLHWWIDPFVKYTHFQPIWSHPH